MESSSHGPDPAAAPPPDGGRRSVLVGDKIVLRKAGGWITWGGMVIALIVGGVAGAVLVAATRSTGNAGAPSASSTAGVSEASTASVCNATTVARKTLPSVVTISATNGSSGGTGSGEVIRENGYILTNNHVISIAAAPGGQVEVLFNDGGTVPATITGRDPKADLAVIKVDGQPPLPVIPFGSSKNVVVGEPVVALGAPLGLSNTVTSGIISALDRTIAVPGDKGQNALLVSALQTDAAINPGNSGGSLTNCAGQLVGVPSAGATIPSSESGGGSSGNIGLGFAIPVDVAKVISDQIIATGKVTHSYFGLSAMTVPSAEAAASGGQGGIYVASVVPGGPAAKAGIKEGDVITSLDGKPVTSTDDLAAVTLTKPPGETVTVEYTRNGQPASTKVTLGAAP
ncbi:trypsin-like peptidase domain-containing protein [Actinoplanes sp. KI2]|uniref:S1C family serine protease n=1 Tax=Actinoplanes sp. KI2 TaxID=2983315 RepID=UPI0021D5F8CC|nr:trypsin-like peptidase domain-containing protein [Actinoplanes sp. KI2]MCU7727763.1 trypsin-like peptidase domain-containing protein [Actinoplanes sp. KI2]